MSGKLTRVSKVRMREVLCCLQLTPGGHVVTYLSNNEFSGFYRVSILYFTVYSLKSCHVHWR